MTDGVSGVLTRIGELDARIRSFDPLWAGVTPVARGVVLAAGSSGAAPSAFTSVLASVATSPGAGRQATQVTPLAGAAVAAGDQVAATSTAMVDPVPGARVTQPYGQSELALEPPATVAGVSYAHFHTGLDLAAALGTPVHAAASGRVIAAGRESDGAVVVRLSHADGTQTLYGHLDPTLSVELGDTVQAGQVIGAIGMTGNTTGPHVHFELSRDGETLDPAPALAVGALPAASGLAGSSGLDPSPAATLSRFDAASAGIPYAGEIRAAAVSAGVDPFLLSSLVEAESSFNPQSHSWAGAMGLTQLMPATATALHVDDPWDPAQNLAGGARYLAGDLRIYGRVDLALAAYQAGKGSVAAAGGKVPDNPTTKAYVQRILTRWSRYLQDGAA